MTRSRFSYFCLVLVLASCESKKPNPEMTIDDSLSLAQDKTAVVEKVDTAFIAAEMNKYRHRITEKITRYDEEIKQLNFEKEKEKDNTKRDAYMVKIESRKKNKKYLQEHLEKMGDKMNEDWKDFKNDVERFFEEEPSGK